MKAGAVVDTIYRYVICGLMVVILGGLMLLAIFSTAEITSSEHTTYVMDNFILQLAVIAGAVGITMWLQNKESRRQFFDNVNVLRFFVIVSALFATMFVLGTQMNPSADSGMVSSVARRIIANDLSPDFKQSTIEYMDKYPNQNGIVVVIYLLYRLIGTGNTLALQVFNIMALYVSYYYIYQVLLRWNSRRMTNVIGIGLCMFLPFNMYVMFVYGTLFGMAFAMFAVYNTIRFVEEDKLRYGIYASAAIAAASCLKSNFLIMFIALAIVCALKAVTKQSWKAGLICVIMTILSLSANPLAGAAYERISGDIVGAGIPSSAWVAMGLQSNQQKAAGWYNGYNDQVYLRNHNDTEAADAEAKAYIGERLKYMVHNPLYTAKFFAKKTASQWNNPTFEGFTFIQDMTVNHLVLTPVIESIYLEEGEIHEVIVYVLNLFQSIILAGAFFWFVLDFQKKNSDQLVYALIFVGGFIFHTIWEAKCQYTVVYFVLLIPYAVMGYYRMAQLVTEMGILRKKFTIAKQ